ncbi:hypothetical protein [Amycolatopsis sp. CB00013]|uniref:hypothetical protein n=1 Tax=Amycolatopsis sp. CB00013 TaxID=1703945 RepID=UPI00093CCB3E|nr:hypothetical protein [Amycolatopsis sp. CB00013]
MLGDAHRRRQRGTDVVIGYVETHGRTKTAGLEVVPRERIKHRGRVHGDGPRRGPGSCARGRGGGRTRPTDVPGSRNAKQWPDVEQLLTAGIDLLPTVNLQHLESLNEVVQCITGVQ